MFEHLNNVNLTSIPIILFYFLIVTLLDHLSHLQYLVFAYSFSLWVSFNMKVLNDFSYFIFKTQLVYSGKYRKHVLKFKSVLVQELRNVLSFIKKNISFKKQ